MDNTPAPETRYRVPALSLARVLALDPPEADSSNPQTSSATPGPRLCPQGRGLWAKGGGSISRRQCKASSQAPGSRSPWGSR